MRPTHRLPLALPALTVGLIAQAGALLVLLFAGERAGATAVAHPTVPGLRVAPRALEQAEPVLAATQVYGAGILLSLLALLLLGFGGGRPLRAGRTGFALAVAAFLACYAALWSAHLAESAGSLFGLPSASAWLLFGLWPAEALFALVFVRSFRSAYWTPEAAARFEALLAERRAARASAEERA